jgi:hypothetical protein
MKKDGIYVQGPPKKTRQGQGQYSKSKHNKKKLRGQGR